jgi:hypothetical protein
MLRWHLKVQGRRTACGFDSLVMMTTTHRVECLDSTSRVKGLAHLDGMVSKLVEDVALEGGGEAKRESYLVHYEPNITISIN